MSNHQIIKDVYTNLCNRYNILQPNKPLNSEQKTDLWESVTIHLSRKYASEWPLEWYVTYWMVGEPEYRVVLSPWGGIDKRTLMDDTIYEEIKKNGGITPQKLYSLEKFIVGEDNMINRPTWGIGSPDQWRGGLHGMNSPFASIMIQAGYIWEEIPQSLKNNENFNGEYFWWTTNPTKSYE